MIMPRSGVRRWRLDGGRWKRPDGPYGRGRVPQCGWASARARVRVYRRRGGSTLFGWDEEGWR